MKATRRRGLLVTALLPVLVVVATGVACAYWVVAGAGSGSAAAGTTQSIALSPGTAPQGLYPGGQSEVAVVVTNPNPGAVTIRSLSLDTTGGTGGFDVDGGHSACGVGALSFTTQTNAGAGWTIPAGASVLSLAGSLAMSTNAADACQGASFTVYLTAGA